MPRWDVTASQVEADTFWDAKGDLAVGSGSDASVKLAVGCTNAHVLQICCGESSGLIWAAAPAATGAFDNGTNNVTSGGTWSVDVDATGTDGACLSGAGTMRFGDGQDLRLYHGGTNNYITGVAGDLIIGTQGSGGGIILDTEDDTLEIKYSGAAGANFGTGGLNLVSGDVFSIACTEVLSGSALASAVKINNANWSGTDLAVANGGTNLSAYAVGDVVYASGTTALSKLAKPGTPAGEVLTFAACASAPSWAAAAGGGAYTLISSQNITGSTATADFECLSGYCTYFLSIASAVPVADGPYAVMQLGCATCDYHESNTDYGWSFYGIHAHPTSSPIHTAFLGSTCSTETSWIVLYRRGVGSCTGEGFSANIWISARACQKPRIHGMISATSYLNEASGGFVVGEYRSVMTMDRVRFKFHSNSIESGRVSLYGVSHA